jgi:hypothetical protein
LIHFDDVDYATSDAASDAWVDAADAASPSYVDPGIVCGALRCDPTSSFCCIDPRQCLPNDGGSTPNTCAGTVFRCDDTADCVTAGNVSAICCLRHNGSSATAPIDCELLADCQRGSSGHAVLCDPEAPNACPENGRCSRATEMVPELGGRYRCTLPDGAPL